MARYKTHTRMEKDLEYHQGTSNAGAPSLTSWTLENGDEECQIKRIVLSIASQAQCRIRLALFQDTPTISTFSDDKVIYSMCSGVDSNALINETTTIRVPRGWHLAMLVDSLSSNSFFANCQLNYLVLS